MKWTKTDEGVYVFSFDLFVNRCTFWIDYDDGVNKYVFGSEHVGIRFKELQATTLTAAKAEALTVVTERLKAIVSQLENAQL
jgi:ppGpp synthetase/RelA/SpoT-type nucleotidyltranferase